MREVVLVVFWWGNLEEKNNLEYLGIDWNLTLKGVK
jgi:hypothetical protein